MRCRVEPEGASHIFIVHGEACTKSERHPTCTHEGWGEAPAGRAYILNFQELLGSDWPGCSPSDYEDWNPGRYAPCTQTQDSTISGPRSNWPPSKGALQEKVLKGSVISDTVFMQARLIMCHGKWYSSAALSAC